ncbi:uncharacterized protein LOC122571245 [Bombus pyrosoma]|uniref:uncharacterized protein LOC122571245 n=1 Tax=Bombus pyrosoma TaxID=396416 RepID=UPI001CB9B085|nr:uncharacterized protein LOC122571245 [Bombus pyrosoma]
MDIKVFYAKLSSTFINVLPIDWERRAGLVADQFCVHVPAKLLFFLFGVRVREGRNKEKKLSCWSLAGSVLYKYSCRALRKRRAGERGKRYSTIADILSSKEERREERRGLKNL